MLKLLIKTRILALLDQFSGQSRGKKALNVKKIALLATAGILLLVLAGCVISLALRPLYASLIEADMEWLYFALTGTVAFLAAFILTNFYAQGAIFEAKDNEMLLSMPIPTSAILGSRVGALYLLNFFFSACFLATAGIVKLTSGGTAVPGGVVVYVLCVFLLALMSTTMSCLLGWGVSVITRRMRRKALFQLLFSLLFLGLYYVIFFGDITRHLKTITENSAGIAEVFRGVLYPFYAMGMACTGKGFTQFLIFAACCIVPFALVWLVLNKSFVKIVTTKAGAKKVRYEATALKSSSTVWALAKKDLSRFFNSSSYMLNAGLGIIYGLGISIYLLITVKALNPSAAAAETTAGSKGFMDRLIAAVGPESIPLLFALLLAALASFSYISGPSISVEGNNLWILKSLPLRAEEVLKSKVLFHLVLVIPASLISSAIYLIAIPMNVLQIAVLVLLPILAHILCAQIGVIANLYLGKVNYPSIAKAVKSNSGALIPMLGTALAVLAPSVLYFTVLKDRQIEFHTILLVTMALLAVLDLGMYLFLGTAAAQKRWDRVGNS